MRVANVLHMYIHECIHIHTQTYIHTHTHIAYALPHSYLCGPNIFRSNVTPFFGA